MAHGAKKAKKKSIFKLLATAPKRSAASWAVPPENGTFFWVDGEKEASSFSQRSIDRGEVLYVQMNMETFQDTFEFVLSNDEMELLPKKSIVRVQPVFQPQLFVTNARTVTQLGLAHFNTTALEGTLPRYLVVQPPKHVRLFLHPNTNQSVLFFTHSDVIAGRLFHAFDTLRRVGDNVLLELRSDSVKPARMVWPIEIRPIAIASTENGRRFGESMVYATINSNRRQQQQMMHSDSANNKIISSSSSSPQMAPTTTAPSSVSAIIPTFHASTGRQSSPTRRVIPTIALPPPSRSTSRERQQILASAAAAAIASKSVLIGTETVAMRRKSLEPKRAQRRGRSEEKRTEAGEAEKSNEFRM
ncbi:hypothetical protein niasHT_025366 [Heterodera trifolii]|uniref:Uncharacterized protein n=1 Tax=Heterodera trifolii TaxID=157864 RepID=A0ABD2KKN3_9BILA